MLACRRLALEAAASLRWGAATPHLAPARASFSSATAACSTSSTRPTREFLGSPRRAFSILRCSVARTPSFPASVLGRSPLQNFLSRHSSPALRARAADFGASLKARAAHPGVRPQLSGLIPLKALGTSTILTMMLRQETAAAAEQARPSKAGPPPGYLKDGLLFLWPLVRKLQLPIGLILLIVSGWQNPLGLIINILLLVYCSTPNRHSIYLFLQELRRREMRQYHMMRREEVVHTRKVDTADYKFYSIGTVELADGKVLHLIGILGSWWIYRVSYAK